MGEKRGSGGEMDARRLVGIVDRLIGKQESGPPIDRTRGGIPGGDGACRSGASWIIRRRGRGPYHECSPKLGPGNVTSHFA